MQRSVIIIDLHNTITQNRNTITPGPLAFTRKTGVLISVFTYSIHVGVRRKTFFDAFTLIVITVHCWRG